MDPKNRERGFEDEQKLFRACEVKVIIKPVLPCKSYKIRLVLLVRSTVRFARLVKVAKISFKPVLLIFDKSNRWEYSTDRINSPRFCPIDLISDGKYNIQT